MPADDGFARADPALIAELYARIRHLGASRPQKGNAEDQKSPFSTGVEALDHALPWGGLPRAGLHEIIAADSGVAAGGFCAALLARLIEASRSESRLEESGTALWCRRGRGLYGPGLASFGLDPDRLIIVHGRSDTDLFWAMEEALRSGTLVGVLGEIGAAHPTARRRLQLAAESHGTMALLLRPRGAEERTEERRLEPSAPTMTRWRVGVTPGGMPAAADAAALGPMLREVRCRWQVELVRCKSGIAGFGMLRQEAGKAGIAARWPARWPANWLVECDETGGLAVAPELRHRSADPAAKTRASI
jgi:protein ImuA